MAIPKRVVFACYHNRRSSRYANHMRALPQMKGVDIRSIDIRRIEPTTGREVPDYSKLREIANGARVVLAADPDIQAELERGLSDMPNKPPIHFVMRRGEFPAMNKDEAEAAAARRVAEAIQKYLGD